MAYSGTEVKSGILITAAIVLLLVLTFIVGDFMTGTTKPYEVRFGYINGLQVDAPVYFSGHEVGKVDKIEIREGEELPVYLKISVRDTIQLREDTEAFIDTLGLMGEKFLELSHGSVDTPVLKPGALITGTDPIPMYLLIQKMNLLADRMDEMTVALNPLVERVDTMFAGHEEDIAKIITNFSMISSNLRDMTQDLKHRPWRLVRKG
ncbi:MAG: MlaD family protein [Candidatus Omnitrophica bacterium]|nr:MlaD family protein [Candidatus Omnitrophota bacterium]MDD5672187.1 MlaD family protein [Candidatus Omnitrophota bacterium]